MSNLNSGREVVVLLPYSAGKLLMQLRDEVEFIDYPGHWGLFGGSIEKDDVVPADAARRELWEEVGYCPEVLTDMGTRFYGSDIELKSHRNMVQHTYSCEFSISAAEIRLTEGMDYGFFSLDEILTGSLYSSRIDSSFPVVPNPVMMYSIEQLFARTIA